MITKNEIKFCSPFRLSHIETKNYDIKVIELEVVERLKQELKTKIHKIRQTQSIYENVSWEEIQEALNDVFGVEGEK